MVLGNNGPAIPEASIANLFDAFFTSGKRGGTGLGLAIAKKAVQAHGGEISCQSDPSFGVEFHFSLPIDAEQKDVHKELSLPANSFVIRQRIIALNQQAKVDKAENLSSQSDLAVQAELENLLADLPEKISIILVDDESMYKTVLTELKCLLLQYSQERLESPRATLARL